jgi:Lipid A 3-O-deacylase (PagL)
VRFSRGWQRFFLIALLAPEIWTAHAAPQDGTKDALYSRTNTFGVFAAYSGNSSHMLLGYAEKRRLLDLGLVYNRRLYENRSVNWQYSAEFLPVALESDPIASIVANQTSPTATTFTTTYGPVVDCAPQTADYSVTTPNGVTYSGTETVLCSGRRWTMGEGMSPIGFQWNFVPRRKTQPFLIGHGGYMYSTQPIPVGDAGSFNFTFDLGAGIEIFQSRTKSIRGEIRYHHISNHGTATENPGIDNLLFQVTYAFGK